MLEKIQFERITLDWEVRTLDDIPKYSGVYQIYGTSPLYGMDTLLYIGKGDNLSNRIRSHIRNKDSFIGKQPNKTFRVAAVEKEYLSIVEDILIVMHKPSFNSARIINVSAKTKQYYYYIQNHGDRGMLNIENTNYYFINENENEENELKNL